MGSLIEAAWSSRSRELATNQETSRQVMGELVTGGANMRNYALGQGESWQPTRCTAGGREAIACSEFAQVGDGLMLDVDTLRVSLDYAVKVEKSSSQETERLFMVPYPIFTTKDEEPNAVGPGELDLAKSYIFLFSETQINDLRDLITSTSSNK